MGDRYFISVTCPYCSSKVDDYYYAPTCGSDNFVCHECEKISFILDFSLVKAEDVKPIDVFNMFICSLNMWTPNKAERESIFLDITDRISSAIKRNKTK